MQSVLIRATGYKDLNNIIWEWFAIARAKNIPVSRKIIQENVLIFAERLSHHGWLAKWQTAIIYV